MPQRSIPAVLLASLLLPLSTLGESPAQEGAKAPPRGVEEVLRHPRVAREFLVRFKKGAGEGRKGAAVAAAGADLKRMLQAGHADPSRRVHLVALREGLDEAAALKQLQADPDVLDVSPNYLRKASVLPNDPSFGTLWGLHNTGQSGGTADADIDAPEAWDLTTGSSSVVVAVLDTGLDVAHVDLAANVWVNPGEIPGNGIDDDLNGRIDDVNGWDFAFNDNVPNDANGHGTHVAGTIGAVGNNGTGVTGVCWTVRIMGLRFLDANGNGSDADAIDAFDYARDLKVNRGINLVAINNSWGGGGFNQALYDAMKDCQDAGILLPCAAGNTGTNNEVIPHFPSNFDLEGVVAVAASDRNDQASSFSNFGAVSVDLFAPGEAILSTYPDALPGQPYQTFDGTSMATPHVAGATGLIRSLFPGESVFRMRTRLLANLEKKGSFSGRVATGGRLNAFLALETDAAAPSAIGNLSATDPSYTAITLSWTAPGDDGASGTVYSYDVRYSATPITAVNFDAASRAAFSGPPVTAGLTQSLRICPLLSSTTYHFAVKAIDNVGNVSPISNVATLATDAVGSAFTVFTEDFQAGGAGAFDAAKWSSAQAPWAEASNLGSVRATDSPAGNYANNRNISLTSVTLNLLTARDVTLVFTHRHALEDSFDFGHVEASPDGGANWYPLAVYTGTLGSYTPVSRICLDGYAGLASVRIRFRLTTDVSVVADGWYLDDILVLADSIAGGGTPTADPQTVNATEDTPVGITLTGSDPDLDPLTFAVTSLPTKGTLSGTAPNLTYTPFLNTNGADSFTFTVSDGPRTSAPATVTINVAPVDDPPTATPQTVSTPEDTPLPITLAGSDPEGDAITFGIVTPPSNGVLSGSGASRTYTPNANFNGADSFTFSASNGGGSSNAVVSITVTSVNDAPVAVPQAVTATTGSGVSITLSGTDVELDPLTFAVVTPPANGTLSGTAPDLTYTSNAGYTGPDSFTFTANDGFLTSAPGLVTITVDPAPARRRSRSKRCGLTGLEALAILGLAGLLRRTRVKGLRP